MTYRKDLFIHYLEEVIKDAAGRKIIILGCRGSGAVTYCALNVLGVEIEYFIDIYTDGKTKMFFNKHVYTIEHIREELPGTYYIINVFPYFDQMDRKLSNIGLVEGRDYTNLHGYFKSKFCGKYDPLLGFSRDDDLTGFKRFGDETDAALRIVTLGGSTTDYSYSAIRSWPEILHELLSSFGIENVVYNGGICGYMSSQERDKFIRDVIPLKPDYVFCLSGINDVAWNHCNQEFPYYPQYIVDQIISPTFNEDKSNDNSLGMGISDRLEDYENWFKNQQIISGVAKEFGIKYTCFLQPCIFTGKYKKSAFEELWLNNLLNNWLYEHKAVGRIFSKWESFYKGARCLINDVDNIFDCTELFDDLSGVYIDGIHCEESGNEKIAQMALRSVTNSGKTTISN